MISILGSAALGVTRGTEMASGAAADLSRISDPEPNDPDIATDFVTLSLGGAQVAISSKVAQAAQEEQKSLLDMIA
jgi:hypothetical protein